MPREAGRTMGASFGDAREDASESAGSATSPDLTSRLGQSVSVAAGATPGPARTILTAAPPPARAPETLLGAAGARGPRRRGRSWPRRRARGVDADAGAGRAPRTGGGRGGAAHAPPSRRPGFLRGRCARPAPAREETLPSQLCDIRSHSRADVLRCKFNSCHWPGAARLFPSPCSPSSPPTRKRGSPEGARRRGRARLVVRYPCVPHLFSYLLRTAAFPQLYFKMKL